MPAGQFCKTCHNWGTPFTDAVGDRFGLCTCPITTTSILKDKDQDSDDAAEEPLWTKEYFGCVNHEGMMTRNRIDATKLL
jgi:hypothetical protein